MIHVDTVDMSWLLLQYRRFLVEGSGNPAMEIGAYARARCP